MMTLNRRRFLIATSCSAAILTAGAAAAWLARAYRAAVGDKRIRGAGGNRFRYDLSRYKTTDPSLVRYDEIEPILTQLREPAALATGPDDGVYVAGDSGVTAFDETGVRRARILLPEKPHALCVDEAGRLIVAFKDRVRLLDPGGRLLAEQPGLGPRTWLTSVCIAGSNLFLADGGNRQVLRCDMDLRVVAAIGRKEPGSSNPGFVVPSPYFDVAGAPDGTVRVANPGRHRVESFSLDGTYQGGWGRASMAVDGFCGCCNPANFTVLPDGRFVTSEKGLNRIKVHRADGALDGVVAGPEHLIRDEELAAQACRDCTIGFGIPVAADSRGRVLALDPMTRSVRVFVPRAAGGQQTA